MNDGLLDLTIGREMPNVYGLVLFGCACLGGRHGFSSLVSYHQVREMRVECKSDTYAQIDGEVFKFDAGKIIDLSMVPQALQGPRARGVPGRQETALRPPRGGAGTGTAAPHPAAGGSGGGVGRALAGSRPG